DRQPGEGTRGPHRAGRDRVCSGAPAGGAGRGGAGAGGSRGPAAGGLRGAFARGRSRSPDHAAVGSLARAARGDGAVSARAPRIVPSDGERQGGPAGACGARTVGVEGTDRWATDAGGGAACRPVERASGSAGGGGGRELLRARRSLAAGDTAGVAGERVVR